MRSRTPRKVLGVAVAVAASAAGTGCGSNELFTLQVGTNERMLDRTATTWVATDQHWFEDLVVIGDLDGDGFDDAILRPLTVFPTSNYLDQQQSDNLYIVYGGPGLSGGIRLEALPSLAGFGLPILGLTIAPVGDVDGDGLADVVITYSNDYACVFNHDLDEDERHGGVFLIYGSRTRLPAGLATLVDHVAVFLRDPVPCMWDAVEARLGDLDGDGMADFVVSRTERPTRFDQPAPPVQEYVFYGRSEQFSGTVDLLASADAVLELPAQRHIVGVGDVDGDGFGDFFVRTALYTALNTAQDVVDLRLVRGPSARLSGAANLADLTQSRFMGDSLGLIDHRTTGVTPLGDLDGDGVGDFALLESSPGFPANESGGPVRQRVFYGRPGGFPAEVDARGDAGFVTSDNPTILVRLSQIASADLDGDGVPDLVITDPLRNGSDGAVYVINGSATRFSGEVPLIGAGRGWIGDRQRLTRCIPDDDFDCIAHEAVGTMLGVGKFSDPKHTDILVSAPWAPYPLDRVAGGLFGPPLARAYLVSPAAAPSP